LVRLNNPCSHLAPKFALTKKGDSSNLSGIARERDTVKEGKSKPGTVRPPTAEGAVEPSYCGPQIVEGSGCQGEKN